MRPSRGTGLSPSVAGPPRPFPSESRNSSPFGLLRFRSPLLTESILFLLLPVLRCFSSRGSLRRGMCSPSGDATYRAGFPHSGTRGSKPEDGSPRPIAAFRALRRQPVPRHPPHALKVACSHAGRGLPPPTDWAGSRPPPSALYVSMLLQHIPEDVPLLCFHDLGFIEPARSGKIEL